MEQFTNNATTSLNGTLTSGATSLSVVSATGFPTSGNFRIVVDTGSNLEIMVVTAVSGTTFTVTRGQENTTAVAHGGGVQVTHILTAGAVGAVRGDWQTVLDLDFTAQSSQSFTTDGSYTIAGISWTKFNSANEATHAQITNGTGLIWQPGSTSDYNASTRTFPGLYVPLSSIIPSYLLDPTTHVRFYLYTSAANLTANFDNVVMAMDLGNSANYGCVAKYGFGTSGQGLQQFWNIGATNLGFQSDAFTVSGGPAATNVMVMDVHRINGHTFQTGFGQYSSGFPNVGTSIQWLGHIQNTSAYHNFGYANHLTNLMLTIGAQRAGSATALSVTMAHLRVDVHQ